MARKTIQTMPGHEILPWLENLTPRFRAAVVRMESAEWMELRPNGAVCMAVRHGAPDVVGQVPRASFVKAILDGVVLESDDVDQQRKGYVCYRLSPFAKEMVARLIREDHEAHLAKVKS